MPEIRKSMSAGRSAERDSVYLTEGGRTYLENLRSMQISKETEQVLRDVDAQGHTDEPTD